MSDVTKQYLKWKVHFPQLIKEVLSNKEMQVMSIPLTILSGLISEVAARASEINDDKLNSLMCRLALYSVSDPYDDDYDENICREVIEKGL